MANYKRSQAQSCWNGRCKFVTKFFFNKRIAVVGNADSLFDSNYGKLIDSHDIVCRFNLGITANNPKSHGTRTDWLIYNNVEFAIKNNLFSYNCKNFIQTRDIYLTPEQYQDLDIASLKNINIIHLSKHLDQDLIKLGNLNCKFPSIGLCFLYVLTHCHPKQVSIFGFDWKKTITFYNANRKLKKELQKKKHDWEKEQLFFYNHILDSHSNFKQYTNDN